MADRLSELAEIVLEKVWKLGYQHRGLIDSCNGTAERVADLTADRDKVIAERDRLSADRFMLAAEVESLRKEVDAGDKALQILAKDRDHWKESRQQAIEAGELMQAEIETLRQKLERSQQQASDFVQTIDENNDRLTEAEARIWPGKTFGDDAVAMMVSEILDLRKELADAKREASEFVERQVLKAVASEDNAELERLRAFVGKVREGRERRRNERDFEPIHYSHFCNRALDELDAVNPAPVTEPNGGAE